MQCTMNIMRVLCFGLHQNIIKPKTARSRPGLEASLSTPRQPLTHTAKKSSTALPANVIRIDRRSQQKTFLHATVLGGLGAVVS